MMRHPFHEIVGLSSADECRQPDQTDDIPSPSRSARRRFLAGLIAGIGGLAAFFAGRDADAQQRSRSRTRQWSTLAIGEEGGSSQPLPTEPGPITTQAIGEEGSRSPPRLPGPITTQAIGEEGSRLPPRRPGPITTQAIGEEGSDSPPRHPPPITTLRVGEEGSSGGRPPPVRRAPMPDRDR